MVFFLGWVDIKFSDSTFFFKTVVFTVEIKSAHMEFYKEGFFFHNETKLL